MSVLTDVAPRLARAHAAELERLMDGISWCGYGGWHANGAGPCFATRWEAIRRRDVEARRALSDLRRYPGLVDDEASRVARLLWRLGERERP